MPAEVSSRVLLTGAGSQLASAIKTEFANSDVLALTRSQLDITKPSDIDRHVSSFRPTLIVNCAAYNFVDRAEDEAETALQINGLAVRTLARAAEASGAVLVHYSTDFVFDGRASEPYREDDSTNPESVYASSKLVGEWFALEIPRSFVLRVASLFGGSPAKGSVDRIVDGLRENREVVVFSDRMVTPGYVPDIAAATRALVERGAPGIYHCVATDFCTWQELAVEAARLLGVERTTQLKALRVAEVSLRAARPQMAALSNAKLRTVFPMPTWQDALARYLAARQSRTSPDASKYGSNQVTNHFTDRQA